MMEEWNNKWMEESGYGRQETGEIERRNDGIPEPGAPNP